MRLQGLVKSTFRTALVLILAILLIAAISPVWSPTGSASVVNDRDFTATNEIFGPHTLIPNKVAVGSGVFLVANTHLDSSTFSQTVILVVEHGGQGSVGIIINRPSDLSLTRLVPKTKEMGSRDDVVYFGGPVSPDGIVLLLRVRSPLAPEQAMHVFDDIYLSSSSSVLERLLRRDDDSEDMFHAYVGYAGWAPGQLTYEIERGDWFVVSGDAEKIFSADPESIWPQMIKALSGQWVMRCAGIEPASNLIKSQVHEAILTG